jgi:multidrug efflux pump subunit AcrA (membrane-fusion protein)
MSILRYVSCRRSSWLATSVIAAMLAVVGGCRQSDDESPGAQSASDQSGRRVAVVKPQRKTIRRAVAQPGRIQAYERTPIVSKIPGYVLKWNVDIGDPIHKGDVLAELWVPELASNLRLKEEQVQQAQKALAMAKAQVETAKAYVEVASAGLGRAESTYEYWKGQNDTFTNLVREGALEKQSQADALNKFRSAAAALSEAKASLQAAKASQQEKESARDKAMVDIKAAEAARQEQEDLVGYAKLTAPYDGIVTKMNVNTKQFVQPATGPKADILYVVERTDIVRIFVSVPETDAAWVRKGTPATVRIQALQDEEIKGEVKRTAWSLNDVTRTLLAEIDFDNPEPPKGGRRLRPGMYAHATVNAEWPDALTLPATAVLTEGDVNVGFTNVCYLVEQGRLKRTPIKVGARNDQLVEVLAKRVPAGNDAEGPRWQAFTGMEEVVRGDLSGLKDGQAVDTRQP